MSERKINRRKLTKYAVGDMRQRISLEQRAIDPPKFDSQSFSENYTLIAEVWASVETKNATGHSLFDQVVDKERNYTHVFVIRWRDDVTSETRIRWKNKLYMLASEPVDPQERGEYLSLKAKLLGSDTKEANQ